MGENKVDIQKMIKFVEMLSTLKNGKPVIIETNDEYHHALMEVEKIIDNVFFDFK